jgi:hypothetical protein
VKPSISLPQQRHAEPVTHAQIRRATNGAARDHKKRHAELRQLEARGRQLADQLAEMDRTEYHAKVALQIARQLRAKQRLLLLAFAAGSLGVASLAVGATWALLLGWR